jgi:hypothetical protein
MQRQIGAKPFYPIRRVPAMPAQRQGEWFLGEKRAKTGLGTGVPAFDPMADHFHPRHGRASAKRDDPAIHVLVAARKKDVDARLKAGHDGVSIQPNESVEGPAHLATCRPQESRRAKSAARR